MSNRKASETKNSELASKRAASELQSWVRKEHPIARLQQTIGNRRVQGLIQAGTAFDETEAEGTALLIGDTVNDALDAKTLAFMESSFGLDFGQVKVHTDCCAEESAEAVSAKAYTVGQDIVFGEGEYSPGSTLRRLRRGRWEKYYQENPGAGRSVGAAANEGGERLSGASQTLDKESALSESEEMSGGLSRQPEIYETGIAEEELTPGERAINERD